MDFILDVKILSGNITHKHNGSKRFFEKRFECHTAKKSLDLIVLIEGIPTKDIST